MLAKSSGNSVNMHSSWVPPGATQSFGSWTYNARNWLSRYKLPPLRTPPPKYEFAKSACKCSFPRLPRFFWTSFRSKGQKDTTCTRDHKQHQNHQILDKATAKAMNRDAIFHQFHRAKTQIRIWKLRTTKCLKSCPFEGKATMCVGTLCCRNKRTSNPTPFL